MRGLNRTELKTGGDSFHVTAVERQSFVSFLLRTEVNVESGFLTSASTSPFDLEVFEREISAPSFFSESLQGGATEGFLNLQV